MKTIPFLALVLCAAFLLVRNQAVRALEEKSITLQSRITELGGHLASEGGPLPDPAAEANERAGKQTPPESGAASDIPDSLAEANLLELALEVAESDRNGTPASQSKKLMNSLLDEASAEELEALALQTEGLDTSNSVKTAMLKTFLRRLAAFEPERALKLEVASPLIDVNELSYSYKCSQAFAAWMQKEPLVALTWFDGQVAAGSFEPKSLGSRPEARARFEASVVSHLLSTDPGMARDRLLMLPEEMREQVFRRGSLFQVAETEDATMAGIVRDLFPPEKQLKMMGPIASGLARRGGYERVSAFIQNIEASDAEREAIVERAAFIQLLSSGMLRGSLTDGDISKLRKFTRTQVPDKTDYITGRALGTYSLINRNYDAAAGIVRDLHTANPNDELLLGFLQKRPRTDQNTETARQLAALIRDETRRKAALEIIK